MDTRNLVFDGQTYFHQYKTVALPPEFSQLAWLKQQAEPFKLYYRSREGDFEVAAAGALLNLPHPPAFSALNDSPARFWGGNAFFPDLAAKDRAWDGFPRARFVLPRIEIIRHKGSVCARINALSSLNEKDVDFSHFPDPLETNTLGEGTHLPSYESWESLVNGALAGIENDLFSKVVVARRSTHPVKVCPFSLLNQIHAPSSTLFAVSFGKGSTFFGATPERLYKRKGSSITTEAVAGTRKRGATEIEDQALEQELLTNEKELREFNFVKTSIRDSLADLCSSLDSTTQDLCLKTPTVQHLYHVFEGQLKRGANDDDLLQSLHPTAAMGGLPKKSSLEYLMDHEPFERGWYASPIGYVSHEEAEFVVGIRSALATPDQLHLFAGTGIVKGSVAEQEWSELNHKTALFRGTFV